MEFFSSQEPFSLVILITGCFALTGYACALTLIGRYRVWVKYAFFYFIFYALLYESSTLIALYTVSPHAFELLIYVKIASAFLLKTSFLLYIAVYIGKKPLAFVFLGIHLISFVFLVSFITSRGFRDGVVYFTAPLEAYYHDGSVLYAIVSNALYVFSATAFLIAYKPFRQKKTSTLILYAILALNAVMLLTITGSSQNVLYEKTHLVIFLALLAFDIKAMPFLDQGRKFISHTNILEGLPEAVIIYDNNRNSLYTHNGLKGLSRSDILACIESEPVFKMGDPGSNTPPGTVTCGKSKNIHLFYRVSPITLDGAVLGKIIILRDITAMVNLQGELEHKNKLLKQAFDVRKACMETARKLASAEERSRVLERVNRIAESYISMVRRDVKRLESEPSLTAESVFSENEKLLAHTREVIGEIRSTVNKLYGEVPSEMTVAGGNAK